MSGFVGALRREAARSRLVCISVTTLGARDELLGYVHDYLSAVARSAAGDLGRLDFVSSWDPALRSRFLEGMAEALKASIEADDPAAVKTYVRLMRRGAIRSRRSSIRRSSIGWAARCELEPSGDSRAGRARTDQL